MLSFGKILLVAVVVFLVWAVSRMGARIAQGGKPRPSRADRVRRAAEDAVRRSSGADREPDPATLDMVQCPSCGNWIAPGGTCNCGHRDTA